MCGIVAALNLKLRSSELRPIVLEMAKKVRHRGPDWSGIFCNENAILAHERLAIVDPLSGGQPLYSPDRELVVTINGEIYNHRKIRSELANEYEYQTQSDCEVVLSLYRKKGADFLDELNGIFAFVLYDIPNNRYLIARDHIGIVPLYTGFDMHGNFFAVSELKVLEGICNTIEEFPPGHYLDSREGKIRPWYKRSWTAYDRVKENVTDIARVRTALENAVHRQLMSDVPYGVLLSGGLDSSIISALAKKFADRRIETDDCQQAWWPQLHSFSVGLPASPDLEAAREVAAHIGTVHHEIHFTIQEGVDAVRDVIYNLETFDVTTVRAATPMYLMARYIKSMGIKMVLSGEGADELFGGYLYFHKAPDARSFHEETVRKVEKLHLYDCLRVNKALAAWGVEGRVPFLDKEFVDVAMTVNPRDKLITNGRIEKWILRKAFEDMLPEAVAWRQKEQFSDGVGYEWIDTLKAIAEDSVTDIQMANAVFRFPVNPPMTKEEYYYRTIFASHFPSDQAGACVPSVASIACSTGEALAWDRSFRDHADPSGRSVAGVHEGNPETRRSRPSTVPA